MSERFAMPRHVEFADTDMAGIVHFTAYFRYMETAEHEMFRSLGLSLVDTDRQPHLGWPRVSCSFDFIEPLHYGDALKVHIGVANVGARSITCEADIVRDGKVVARGRSTSTCCEVGPGVRMRPVAVPAEVREKLRRYRIPSEPSGRTTNGDSPYLLAVLVVWALFSGLARADDWPRFLGPQGNSISAETGINKDWGTQPPEECWRVSMTDEGFSGPAVKDQVVYIHDHADANDVIRALDAGTGQEIWRFAYPQPGPENHGFTRATPTVEDGRVYTVSRTGVVYCLDAAGGSPKWRADVMERHGGEPPEWGAANSALIDGERLIAIAAGENSHVVALDKETGATIWAGGGTDIAGYGTPVLATLDGKSQYLVFTGKSLIGVAADDGTLLWRHPWETRLDSNASAPIVVDENSVWIASGYRRGCALLRIEGDEIHEVWSRKDVTPHWSSAALVDDHLYTTTPPGYLVCVEAKTGKEKWRNRGTARGFEHGGLIAVDGTLIVIEGNTGNVVQVALTTEGYRELGRVNPLRSARCWTAPVIADKKLYVRSPEELVCLDVRP